MQTFILTVAIYSVSGFLETFELTFRRLWDFVSGFCCKIYINVSV